MLFYLHTADIRPYMRYGAYYYRIRMESPSGGLLSQAQAA